MRKIFFLTIIVVFIQCTEKNKTRKIGASKIQSGTIKDSIKNLKLPFCSDMFNFTKKDKNGVFIYDNSYKKDLNSNQLKKINGTFNISNIKIFCVETKIIDDEHVEPNVILYSYLNKKKIDSLTIYETIKWEGSFNKRFCVNKNNTIKITENSLGYDITNSGNDTIIKTNGINYFYVRDDGFFENKIWKGNYYFEATNKDNFKTSFKINIMNLNDISIEYISDGEEPEIYKNLKAGIVENNKIKINFNTNYNEMGILFIGNNGNKFTISGQPIYIINTGDDNLPLEKR